MATPLNIAHRGARSVAPENTLAAARAAAALGADGWEFDVRRTADGELVLVHDETLTRTTNARDLFPDRSPWRVAEFTLAEIRTLDAGSWFVREDPYGTLRSGEVSAAAARAFRGERVPILREALLLSRELGLWVNIELKGAPLAPLSPDRRATVEEVAAAVRELGMEDRVLISSFDHEMIRHLKAVAPGIPGALLTTVLPPSAVDYARALRADAVNPSLEAYTPEWGHRLQEAGLRVYVWTVDDPAALGKLAADPHVTGLITDWPQRLRAILGR
ncbi:MAG: glycerophosphodiester phosphodiesterase family protein [Candidatus Bipolaricaulota bacterium]|nr:glycerophosphodiester phosphodiesterase family protein [Candidatus Bipolaricaulota bacterium]